MSQHELSKVPRRIFTNPFATVGPREWWYSWVGDPATGRCFSFFFYRMSTLDSARITVSDPSTGTREVLDWKGWLDEGDDPGRLHLQGGGAGGIKFVFRRRDGAAWSFRMSGKGWDVELDLDSRMEGLACTESIPPAEYGSLQTFGCRVRGKAVSPGPRARFDGSLGYFEHSWGELPRHAHWRWFQAQNEEMRIVAMQGVNFQSFCRVHHGAGEEPWIELRSRPVFVGSEASPASSGWVVESEELRLEVELLQDSLLRERIPPLVPFCVDLFHHECPARVRGRIKLQGVWRDTGELFGSFELHRGTW